MYDYVVIGGGITGLYTIDRLVEKYGNKKSYLLLDERNYFGGRLITHKQPHYEIGGARFNDNHVLLKKLLKKYNLTKIPLNSQVDYIHHENNSNEYYTNADKTFNEIVGKIIKYSKKITIKELSSYTLEEFIDKVSGSKELSTKLINIFGYSSEFTKMNARDSLESLELDFVSSNFYVLKEGFSELCRRMVEDNKDYATIKNNTHVDGVNTFDDCYIIQSTNVKTQKKHIFYGKKVIFALKANQLNDFKILKPIKEHINCIHSAPLLRIYARYPSQKIYENNPWFYKFNRMTTNSILRHIIPIDPSTGLIMISYTDGDDINVFFKDKEKMILKQDKTIKEMIKNELQKIFPSYKIPNPVYFKTHLWHIGAHHWKPRCNSKQLYKKIRNPLNNVYVVGEAFSRKQAWIEGGLESVEDSKLL